MRYFCFFIVHSRYKHTFSGPEGMLVKRVTDWTGLSVRHDEPCSNGINDNLKKLSMLQSRVLPSHAVFLCFRLEDFLFYGLGIF